MASDPKLLEYLKPLEYTHEKAATLVHRLAEAYNDLALHSTDQFLATPITKLPTGKEKGEFLAIDLGGSNLRVAFVNLLGPRPPTRRKYSLHQYDERIEKYCERSYPIGNSLKNENPEDLFAWIGDCLAEVIRARYEDEEVLPEVIPLGITFSFPMMQNTLSEATLMPMGKGFSITSNPDLGSMMMAGYARHTQQSNGTNGANGMNGAGMGPLPKIKLVAISNDSVATLISLSYTFADANSKAVIGLILGTGCNAAVPMKPKALHADKVAFATKGGAASDIVVNTEWTIRGVGPALRSLDTMTRWDDALDAALPTPGFQPFEYMTAGAYIGEVVRLAVHEYLVEHLHIDAATLPEGVRERNRMDNAWLGHNVAIAADDGDMVALANRLNNHATLGHTSDFSWDERTADVLLQAERAVQRRSTLLIAAAIVALLVSIEEIRLEDGSAAATNGGTEKLRRELVVAYCGGLICLYHGYERRLRADLDEIMARVAPHADAAIVLREASEGGVIGAGVLAGTAWPEAA